MNGYAYRQHYAAVERGAIAIRMRRDGFLFKEIGAHFGVSTVRARQIYLRGLRYLDEKQYQFECEKHQVRMYRRVGMDEGLTDGCDGS